MCKKWIRTSELAAFEAITFTGTFGPLLWEKFYPVRGSQQYSLLKKFRALNFRGLGQQRKFFNNETFPIYGIIIINIIVVIFIIIMIIIIIVVVIINIIIIILFLLLLFLLLLLFCCCCCCCYYCITKL